MKPVCRRERSTSKLSSSPVSRTIARAGTPLLNRLAGHTLRPLTGRAASLSRISVIGVDFCDNDPKHVVFVGLHSETQIGTIVVRKPGIDCRAMIVLVNR